MLSTLTTPPQSISPEEHAQLTSSTPSSFIDIPPVLRWSDQVEVVMSSPQGGWESWPAGRVSGMLYVTEDAVAFLPTQGITPGFNLPFPALTLHALTPANGTDPAHLYCQIDESDAPAGPSSMTTTNGSGTHPHLNGGDDEMDQEGAEDEDEGDGTVDVGEEYTELREVRIFLNESKLEPLFQALSSCSALHASLLPNGEPSSFFGFSGDDDDEDNDGQWEDADEDQDGQGQGREIRIDFGPTAQSQVQIQRQQRSEQISDGGEQIEVEQKQELEDGDEEVEQVVDQMERFLGLVDWGNVQKPAGWDEK